MADEGSPLLRLGPPRSFTRRKGPAVFVRPPDRRPTEHGRGLRLGLDEVRRHFDTAIKRVPTFATDVPYVRIELARGMLVSDAELSSLGLIPVYRREDAILAAYSRDRDLRTFRSQLASYAQLKKTLAVFAKIETIKPWSRDDKTGTRLKGVTITPSNEYTVDLLLMPVEDERPNAQAVRAIEHFVQGHRGSVVDRALEPTFAALRVRLGGQALDEILDYRDDVALVDLPPSARVIVPEALSLTLDELPDIAAPSATAPALCVVDSGILEGHPLLEPAIVSDMSRSFPPELGPPVPAPPVNLAGHGTRVAGIALYGDVGTCAHTKSFVPTLRVINIRMLDDNNALHPNRMPFLRDVVEHVKDQSRVLNLSFGLEPHGGFLSVHAAELDALTREFGVLFVVSSGNDDVSRRFNGQRPSPDYPEYLVADDWRVLSPAEALNVLTVGGITPDRGLHQPHPSREVIPSPARYSRCVSSARSTRSSSRRERSTSGS